MPLLESIQNKHPEFLQTLEHRFLDETRKNALSKFLDLGFPTKKDEEYKYTNLREITEKEYSMFPVEEHHITEEQLTELHLGEENFDWIVFINGKLHKELSKISIENVEFMSFKHALNDEKYKGRSRSHCDKVKIVMNAMFRQAAKSRLIPFNPAEDLIVTAEEGEGHRSITPYEREIIHVGFGFCFCFQLVCGQASLHLSRSQI